MSIDVGHEMILREARKLDLKAICELLESSGLPSPGVAEHLDSFLVMENAECIIGCIGLELYGEYALLRSLAVKKIYRGIGLGIRLYDATLQKAERRGVKRLVLLTETAEGFFRKLGFEVVSRDVVHEDDRMSVEFRDCCPDSAECMMKIIG